MCRVRYQKQVVSAQGGEAGVPVARYEEVSGGKTRQKPAPSSGPPQTEEILDRGVPITIEGRKVGHASEGLLEM